MSISAIISEQIEDHVATVQKLSSQIPLIEDLAARIIGCFNAGGKVLIFGNGGSAADAQHIAAEFVVRYRRNRKALPAIALTTDTSVLTAGGNDFGFESIYARQVEALGREGDVVIGISTSGTSANVIAGLDAAKKAGCLTVAFTGEKSSPCADLADVAFRAPSLITARVQECHLLVGHILCDIVEEAFAS
jgi:D-sedoheptulose 7-phosphate isomerase